MKALAIARRELGAYFLSPVSWIVLTLFLLIEGYSFWLFCELLNGRDTPHGAVLQYFFGGTFLYWLFVMFLVAVLTMRLLAEEKRSGTIEPLLTTPVELWEVIAGKFLGAVGFWAASWAPTLLYVIVLRAHAPEGAAPDAGPIAAGYLGTLLVGAGAIALGLLASALTRNQILAAVLAFVTLVMLLLVGVLGDALVRTGPWAEPLRYLNLFRHMEDFGRGIVDTRRIAWHLGLIVLGLFAAARALRPSRRGLVEVLLVAALVAGGNWLAARHYLRGDWTRGRTFALSEKTIAFLHELKAPVDVLVFMIPSGEDANDLYGDVRELLERARRETPLLHVEWLDIDRDPERLKLVGKKYGVTGEDLVSGVIVVASADGKQSKFISHDELGEYEEGRPDEPKAPRLRAWKGEQALDTALLAVTEEKARTLCFTQGHGEPAIDSFEAGEYGTFAEELKRNHYQVKPVDLVAGQGAAEIPAECDLTIVAGPEQPFQAADRAALERLVESPAASTGRPGRLLVLLGPTFDPQLTRFVDTGLEDLLERWGASLRNDLVVDEPHLRGSAFAFGVSDGYSDHPITARLAGRRTLWSGAREVRAVDPPGGPGGSAGWKARELLHTSDRGFGTTRLELFRTDGSKLEYDPQHDVKGPIPLGVASERAPAGGPRARVVVLGSADLPANRQVLGYNRDLLLSSVAWLLEEQPKLAIGPRTPEHLRLELDDGQLRRIFLVCVIGLPLFALLVGLGVFWVRRT